MKFAIRFPVIVGPGLSLALSLFAALQSQSTAAPQTSDQIKKQAEAQKKAAEAKEKWVKAQEKVKSKQADLDKAPRNGFDGAVIFHSSRRNPAVTIDVTS